MPVAIICPACQKRLKVGDHLVGKKVRCPKCQHILSVQQEEGAGVEEHSMTRDVATEPRQRRRRTAKRKSKNVALYVGLGSGAVVMAVALIGAGLWLFRRTAANDAEKPAGTRLLMKDGKVRKDIPGFAGISGTTRPYRQTVGNHGFTFTVPSNRWYISGSGMRQKVPGMALAMEDRGEDRSLPREADGEPLPHLTVIVEDHDGSPIETISQQAKADLTAELKDWRLLDEKYMMISAKKAYRIASSAMMPTDGQSEEIHMLQFFYIGTKGKVFVLTFSTGPITFSHYRAKFEKSGESAEVE